MRKMWLDDVRPIPEGFDVWCKCASSAIRALKMNSDITYISFDHDLGDDDGNGTGYDVACFLEQAAFDGTMNRIAWKIHSANPVGRKNITAAMEAADQFWTEREEGRW